MFSGLPYHRPKQRSLAEFLARKKGQPEIVSHIKETRFQYTLLNIFGVYSVEFFWRICKQLNSSILCRFDPYAQQKLEQREEALKKFYKAEDGADEGHEEEGTGEVQGAKVIEVEEGLGEHGGVGAGPKATGESVTPSLSSVFDEEALETEQNGTVTDNSVKDNVACEVGKNGTVMESREAPNLESAEEESEKLGTFAEEELANEELRTDENAGPAVENSETLKLVLEDTVAEVLDDTVVEKDDTVDEEKKGVEEVDSLKLVLEPDTPIEEEEEIILSSQVNGIQTFILLILSIQPGGLFKLFFSM